MASSPHRAPSSGDVRALQSRVNHRHPFIQGRSTIDDPPHAAPHRDEETPAPAAAPGGDPSRGSGVSASTPSPDDDEHVHYSHRAPWLRATVLGANDGLVSTASLMLGVSGGDDNRRAIVLAGVAGLVAGALSMAAGEYISVASQRDAELADVAKEAAEQAKGPAARAAEQAELAAIYQARGLSPGLAAAVAEELSSHDNDAVVRHHARDELGIDLDALANPFQAAAASAAAFTAGAAVPLLASAFIVHAGARLGALLGASCATLVALGATGAYLGGAPLWRGAARVLTGGAAAMALTYGVGRLFALGGAAPMAA